VAETSWLEIAKLVTGFATPIVVGVVGILLLRRIEGVKSQVGRQSDFNVQWAKEFFDSCQNFLRALEREMAILAVLAGLPDPNDDYGTGLQKEASQLHPTISELELRIRRCVGFAPNEGPRVEKAARACIELAGSLVTARQGSFDKIIDSMNEFNSSARRAHAEMLQILAAKTSR